jgi:hypothetical protein
VNARDWYIMVHVSLFGFAIIGYAYKNPSPGVFATACATLTTVIGMYHWFTIRDDKTPDARDGR